MNLICPQLTSLSLLYQNKLPLTPLSPPISHIPYPISHIPPPPLFFAPDPTININTPPFFHLFFSFLILVSRMVILFYGILFGVEVSLLELLVFCFWEGAGEGLEAG